VLATYFDVFFGPPPEEEDDDNDRAFSSMGACCVALFFSWGVQSNLGIKWRFIIHSIHGLQARRRSGTSRP
jgi:hypothetical protein